MTTHMVEGVKTKSLIHAVGVVLSDDHASYVERYLEACNKSGLIAVKAAFLKQTALKTAALRAQHVIGRPLSDAEMMLWQYILPQTSGESRFHRFIEGGVIPLPVLQRIADAKTGKIFDRVEMWHKERIHDDPMAVGVIEFPAAEGRTSPRYYCLGRWGKEDANFLSVGEVKKQVQEIATNVVRGQSSNDIARRGKIWTTVQVLTTLASTVGFFFLLASVNPPPHLSQETNYILAGFLSVMIGATLAGMSAVLRSVLHVSYTEKFSKAYEVLKAIPQVPDEENYGLSASVPA